MADDLVVNGGVSTGAVTGAGSTGKKADVDKDTTTSGLKKTAETATMESASGKSLEELEDEVFALESQKGLNYKKMERIEAEIKELINTIKDNMKKAKELQEKAIEEHQDQADKAVEDNLAAYVEANKEGGKGMTKEELESNISASMPDSPNLAKAIAKYVTASRELAEVDSLLDNLNSLVIDTNVIEMDLDEKTKAMETAESAASKSSSCTDPIGFMKDGARYDFIVDDGSFDSTSDFLGADKQWASMEALDSDGDKIIDANELKAAGIKVVKTKDGKQEVKDITEEFDQDFKIDLNSYKQGGSYNGIDTTKDTDNDGTVDQELLGTYTIKVGNQELQGYNTLDDTDYLASEYNIKAADLTAGAGAAAGTDAADAAAADSSQYSEELKVHSNFFNEYTEEVAKIDKELNEGLASLGLTESTIKSIKDHAKAEAKKDADTFMEKATKESEEAQKADDAKRQEELDAKRKKREEEAAKAAAAKTNGGTGRTGGAGGAGGAGGGGGNGGDGDDGDSSNKREAWVDAANAGQSIVMGVVNGKIVYGKKDENSYEIKNTDGLTYNDIINND